LSTRRILLTAGLGTRLVLLAACLSAGPGRARLTTGRRLARLGIGPLPARLGTGSLRSRLGTGPLPARLGGARETPVGSRPFARRGSATSASAPSSARTTASPLSARVVCDRAEESEREPRSTNAHPDSRLHGFAPFLGEALGDGGPC